MTTLYRNYAKNKILRAVAIVIAIAFFYQNIALAGQDEDINKLRDNDSDKIQEGYLPFLVYNQNAVEQMQLIQDALGEHTADFTEDFVDKPIDNYEENHLQ